MNRLVIADPDPGIGCHTDVAEGTATDKRQGLQVIPRQSLVKFANKATPMTYRYGKGAHGIRVCTTKAIHLVNNVILSESSKGKRLKTVSIPSNMTRFAESQEGEK